MDEIKTSPETPRQEIIKETKKKIKLPKKTIFVILLVLSLSFNIFLSARLIFVNGKITGNSISSGYYPLIKLQEKIPTDSDIQGNSILHYDELKIEIEKEIKNYNATKKIGIFLQDVNTGTWLGINERDEFTPASLMKIPIMMAILKKVERQEIKLTDTIILTQEDLDENYGDLYKKEQEQKSVWQIY